MLGVAGLLGSGRTELARAISGIDKLDAGIIRIQGSDESIAGPRSAISLGIVYSSENRRTEGIISELSVQENITLALQAERGILRRIRPSRQRELALSWVDALDIRPPDVDRPAGTLSGGNQQKVLLARLLALSPRLLVLDEPTRGIDVGAKVEVQNLIGELADNGLSVMFISAELEEVLRVGNRVAGRAGRPHRRHRADRGADRRLPHRHGGPSRRCVPSGRRVSPAPARGRAANIFDVARLAGVSHQTVSRVINDMPNVRPSTRERVEQAIAQLQYSPSPAARALVTRRTRTIGLVSPAISDYGPTSIAMAFNFAARAARYNVETVSAPPEDTKAIRAVVDGLLRQRVDAIMMVVTDVEVLEMVRSLDLSIPVVVAASTARRSPLIVSIDQYRGARSAVRHLAELGHTRILHIAGPKNAADAIERVRGWRDELAAQRLDIVPPVHGDWSAASGHRLGSDLDVRPDMAVFVGNDQMSIGLFSALRERGLRVPEDVSVIGFDDIPEAGYLFPPLTTVRQEFDVFGEVIMQKVLIAIEESAPLTEDTPLPTHLILRQSTRAIDS